MKISIIITISGNDIDRYVNLIEVLKSIKSQTYNSWELIIVEHSTDHQFYYNLIPYEMPNMHYYQICGPIFNVSWGRNVGIYKSTGDIICVLDADYVLDYYYLDLINCTKVINYYLGWSKLYKTSYEEKLDYLKSGIMPIVITPTNISNINTGWWGGIQIFNRQWFIDKIGGFSEDMYGWGNEDKDVALRSYGITGEENILDYTAYHLFHRCKQGNGVDNPDILERNGANPVFTAQLMRDKGVGNVDHITPIY